MSASIDVRKQELVDFVGAMYDSLTWVALHTLVDAGTQSEAQLAISMHVDQRKTRVALAKLEKVGIAKRTGHHSLAQWTVDDEDAWKNVARRLLQIRAANAVQDEAEYRCKICQKDVAICDVLEQVAQMYDDVSLPNCPTCDTALEQRVPTSSSDVNTDLEKYVHFFS